MSENQTTGRVVSLVQPADRECLMCFVARMLDGEGCDTTLRFATRYRDRRAPRATRLETRLGQMGGFCDCEIFLNGVRLADHHLTRDAYGDLTAPAELPPCGGVRRGSARACDNWVRRTPFDAW